jgi:hypothetical protein
MSKRRSKSTRKIVAQSPRKAPRVSPVEKAWGKFVIKFVEFQKLPKNENDKAVVKQWERELKKTDRSAYAVMEKPATCLHDIELKIRAWAFVAEVKTDDTLISLEHWQPHRFANNSDFIASLRDDVRLLRNLVTGATLAVSSIGATPPMPSMPRAIAYPAIEETQR